MKTALSHVCIKLLTAVLLFGLSAASIAGNVALNKPATQTSTINRGNANLAVDNNWATIAQTLTVPGQSWKVDLGGRYRDATVQIFGKKMRLGSTLPPIFRDEYGPSTLEFMLGTKVVQTNSLVSSSAPNSSRNPIPQQISSSLDVIFDRVRVNNVSGQGLTLGEVHIDAQPYVDNRPNVALGKPTFQTSTLEGQGTSDIAVDGNEDWMTHTLNGPSEYWKVDLLFPYKISSISIVNRQDCCGRRILGATVQILSGGAVAYSHVINENDLSSDPYLEFTVPAGTAGDSVRVLNKPNEYLSMAEVRVNGVYSYPFPTEGAPGAVMSFKSGQFLGQPVLLNGGLPRSAYGTIKGVNDAVNVSPPLDGYGAATITNSASVQNQTLVRNGKNENIAEISTFAFGLARPTRIKFRAGLDTGKASSLVIDGVPRTLQMYGQWWEGNWGKLNDIGWTEFVDLPAGNHTFQVYGVENCCSNPQSFQYQIEGGQWTNFSANDPVLAVRPFGDVLFTPSDQTYYSLPTFTLPPKASGGYETLFFKVRASNDAHIKLGCFRDNIDIFYEIVLGGWGNQRSVMRPIHNSNAANGPDGAVRQTPNILSGNEDRDFWIATDGATNTIRVGRGTDPTQGEFMSWANPPSFPWTGSDRTPLCFQFRTGWGSTGTWSGIRNTRTSIQQNIDSYSSFVAAFPPPPGAGPLFNQNWIQDQWTSSNKDPETFRRKLRDQAQREAKIQETFPESDTTIGDLIEAYNYLSESDVTQLVHPDFINYIKLLAQPGSLENNLMMGKNNKTIVINNTPIAIFSPGHSNQGLDTDPNPTPLSTIGLNSNTGTTRTFPFLTNSEFQVAIQSNLLLPLKSWTAGKSYAVPFDANVSYQLPLFALTAADYRHQGRAEVSINGDILPMKITVGLTVDAFDFMTDLARRRRLQKIMGVSVGAAVKAQVSLICRTQHAGACQVQNIKFYAQFKGGVEVVKAFQYGWKKIVAAYKRFGGTEEELVYDLTPAELRKFLEADFVEVDRNVSAAITDGYIFEGFGAEGVINNFLAAGNRSAVLVGAAMGSTDRTTYVSEQLLSDGESAADGDPTAEVAQNFNGERYADPESNRATADEAAGVYKTFCDNKVEGEYSLECTTGVTLDLALGLQWENNYALTEDPFITGYDFHSSPDAIKAAVTMRLTPGWEARLDNVATFKLRVIPSWTYSFLYHPLTTLGERSSPILTSEE